MRTHFAAVSRRSTMISSMRISQNFEKPEQNFAVTSAFESDIRLALNFIFKNLKRPSSVISPLEG